MSKVGAVILAAGKGKRMKLNTANKVTLQISGKPMIVHALDLVKSLNINPTVVVIGFAKESVKKIITENAMPAGRQVIFAEQKKRLGTAHALAQALKVLPKSVTDILVIQGDDAAFYNAQTLASLIKKHTEAGNSLTFLTIEIENPGGLGRIIRDKNGQVVAIAEEKDANPSQRKITEINPACYVFNIRFLRKYLKKVQKSKVSGEYYIVSLVDIAIKNKEKIEDVKGGTVPWRGVNTKEELEEAQTLFQKIKSS